MAPHVTVPEQTARTTYTVGATATSVFAIPWTFFDEDDIRVYVDDELQALTTDYTVSGTSGTDGGFLGGTVTLEDEVTNVTVTIVRSLTIERTSDFPKSGPLNRQAENTQFDKFAAMIQDLDRDALQLDIPGDEYDAQGAIIGNLANGTANDHAVNLSQLNAVVSLVGSLEPDTAKVVASRSAAMLLTLTVATTFVLTAGYASPGDGG